MKKLSLFVGVMAFVFAATAVAQTVPVADRPIVLKAGGGEAALDIGIGLDKDAMAKKIGLWNGYVGDRYGGLSFGYGVMDKLEVGLAAQLGYQDKKKYGGDSSFKFYGAYIYGKYAFLDMLAAELGIRVPGEKFGDNRVGITIGVPFQYVAVPGMLKIHARPDFIIDFKKKDTLGGGKSLQMGIFFDAGATFNATPELFFDLSFGVSKGLTPSKINYQIPSAGDGIGLPLAVTAGYTVMPAMDVYLNFALNNLLPKDPIKAMDQKSITLGANYRF